MQIFQSDLNKRLGREFISIGNRTGNGKYFLIVHTPINSVPASEDAINKLNESIRDRLYNGCAGILFVKGSSYSGLGREKAEKLQKEYDNKIHFLSYAVAGQADLPNGYEERFEQFFNKIRNENIIDWELIDPPSPKESIVAALLLLEAALRDCDVANVGGTIWLNTVKEYNEERKLLSEAGKKPDGSKDLDEEFPRGKEDIKKCIDKLKKYLQPQKPQ